MLLLRTLAPLFIDCHLTKYVRQKYRSTQHAAVNLT